MFGFISGIFGWVGGAISGATAWIGSTRRSIGEALGFSDSREMYVASDPMMKYILIAVIGLVVIMMFRR